MNFLTDIIQLIKLRMWNDDNKLVAAHTITGLLDSRNSPQAVRNSLQKHISILMSQSVVDVFEIVQVQIQ